eukprot:TRINITY_DN36913_c0_g1_i1.p1 TRINITY_DN36913_c0_g1~~TRINITY_DN36913_c0_g1_i1.p1  ORF type:complete len:152 (-),score=41.86 TRINITY_DN36913_c0_g1_i1:197-652(-)
MRSVLLILSFTALASSVKGPDCGKLVKDMNVCHSNAFTAYKAAIKAGDDEKPEWMARKSCNYMTEAVEVCNDLLLGECYTEEKVNRMKEQQLKGILKELESTVDEWDSDKCPPVWARVKSIRGEVEDGDQTLTMVSVVFSKCVDVFSLITY